MEQLKFTYKDGAVDIVETYLDVDMVRGISFKLGDGYVALSEHADENSTRIKITRGNESVWIQRKKVEEKPIKPVTPDGGGKPPAPPVIKPGNGDEIIDGKGKIFRITNGLKIPKCGTYKIHNYIFNVDEQFDFLVERFGEVQATLLIEEFRKIDKGGYLYCYKDSVVKCEVEDSGGVCMGVVSATGGVDVVGQPTGETPTLYVTRFYSAEDEARRELDEWLNNPNTALEFMHD